MYQVILNACLAVSTAVCAPVLLPAGEAARLEDCRNGAGRIARDWLERHPDLIAGPPDCQPVEALPALPLREIAPGIHLFQGQPVQLEDSPDGHIANLGVIIGTGSVAVVDSGVSRAQGQALFVALRRLTDLPVSHVILTHMHPDHSLGASVFREAGARVTGHAALPPALEMRAGTYLQNLARLYPADAVLGTEVVIPDLTVADRLDIDLGGRRIRLRAVPVAHTDNDLTVFDPATGTLFAGDLIFRRLTPVLDGSLAGWLDWSRLPPDEALRLLVPGHGPTARGWDEAVTAQRRFLQALEAATRARIAAGEPMSDAVPKIADDLKDMEKDWNSFEATTLRDATAAYKELEWE